MRKIKIKAKHISNPRMELEYYLLLKGGTSGIEIRDTRSAETATRFIPDSAEKVYSLLLRYARHGVTPETLKDVVDDYVYTQWLC